MRHSFYFAFCTFAKIFWRGKTRPHGQSSPGTQPFAANRQYALFLAPILPCRVPTPRPRFCSVLKIARCLSLSVHMKIPVFRPRLTKISLNSNALSLLATFSGTSSCFPPPERLRRQCY